MSDYKLEDSVYILFTTRAFATGIPGVLSAATVAVYEDVTATPIETSIAVTETLNSINGLNAVTIAALAASGYNAGGHYHVVIEAGTVDSVSVVGEVVGNFSIQASPVNWAKVSAPTTAVDLSATDIQLVDTVTTYTGNTPQTADHTAGIADTPTVSEFNARTLVAASYFDPAADTVATVTDVTNGATAANLATAQADLDIITDADGVVLGAAGVDLIWDELLTGAAHNVATSAGRRLRQIEQAFVHASGTIATVTNGHTFTLDAGAVATADYYIGDRLQITEGTGAGQSRLIIAYSSGKVAILDSDFTVNPDTSSLYEIDSADVHVSISDSDLAEGFVATYTNTTTITLDSTIAVATTDFYVGEIIVFTHGTGSGQAREITGYTSGRVVTMSPALVTALDTTTVWHIQAAVSIPEIVDEVWDEVISKAAHNVAQSSGKILRQSGDITQISGSISDAAPSTSDFDTDLTQVDTFFDDSVLVFVNGAANAGIGITINAYLNANGNVSFLSPDLWPVTPVNGDDFIIFSNHVHPVAQIADGVWDEPMAAHTTADTSGLVMNELQDGGRLDLILDIIAVDTTTDIPALIAALNDVSTAEVLTQINAALDTAIAELGVAAPSATPTVRTALILIYMALRNQTDVQTSGTDSLDIYNDAGTKITSKLITDDGTDYSEAKMT